MLPHPPQAVRPRQQTTRGRCPVVRRVEHQLIPFYEAVHGVQGEGPPVRRDGAAPGDLAEGGLVLLVPAEKVEGANDLINFNGHREGLPLYVGEKDGATLYIIPVSGRGLWDAIWGYIAVDKDLIVRGVFFDHKGETAGLGVNIKERYFMDDFMGEHRLFSGGVSV